MKRRLYFITGLITLALVTSPVVAKAGSGTPTLVLEAYSTAIADKKVDEMAKYVAQKGTDFTVFEGAGANFGWANYRDHHLAPEFANSDLVFHTYAYKDINTHRVGDLAYSTFSIEMVYTYKGEGKSRTGRGTAILRYIDGAWKIIHLHTS